MSRESVKRLGDHLRAFDGSFPSRRFVREASRGLEDLELKARINHVADALATCLPEPFPRAAALIRGANEGARRSDESVFAYWPLCSFVERHGLSHFDEAFDTMHGLTGLASCEFAVRPFIEGEPDRAFSVLRRWVGDRDHHVRRLVSEGTRPRLPWGARLTALQEDPTPSVPLLDRLFSDEELYVRRSVANHLNDISKDHPDRAVAIAEAWKAAAAGEGGGAGRNADWVVRHALRGLVKGGHRGALALQGFRPAKLELGAFSLKPRRLRFGAPLRMHLELRARAGGEWMIDYAVHRQLANGKLAPKVFKWTRRTVKRGESIVLDKDHAIRAITTRRYYPGRHRVEVLVNGQSVAVEDFELVGVPR